MTKEELYDLLEIDTPADLEYFEQMADLLETEEEISRDLFRHALSEIRAENAGEFAENYVGELMNVPCGEGYCHACFDGEYPTAVPETNDRNRFDYKISEGKKV